MKDKNVNLHRKRLHKNRRDYLECLADDYGVECSIVACLAGLLGADEDWDGLVNALEDYVEEF